MYIYVFLYTVHISAVESKVHKLWRIRVQVPDVFEVSLATELCTVKLYFITKKPLFVNFFADFLTTKPCNLRALGVILSVAACCILSQ